MFTKLRNDMVVFIMATVSLVVILAFSAVYLVSAGNADRATDRQLAALLAPNPGMGRGGMGSGMGSGMMSERFGPEYRVSFITTVRDGIIQDVSSRLDLDPADYTEAVARTGGHDRGTVSVTDRSWAFSRAPLSGDPGAERIAFLDVTDSANTLRNLALTLTAVGLAVLLAIFGLSLWFAHRAVQRSVRATSGSSGSSRTRRMSCGRRSR